MSPLYSRKTPRAQRYNYSSEGFYFVTICTKNRVDYFGEIIDKKMILSDNGKICNEEIKKLQKRNTVDIHERIVMPNHVHILIEIKKYPCRDCRDALMGRPIDDPIGRPIGDHYQGPTLGSVINIFKGNVTKYVIKNNDTFARQSRYHDHIIRNQKEYEKIVSYIKTNAEKRRDETHHKYNQQQKIPSR